MNKYNFKVGKSLDEDIIDVDGRILLVSKTILHEDHLQKLNNHKLKLKDESNSETTIEIDRPCDHLILEASKEIETIFNVARYAKNIQLMDIKIKILPIIKHMVDNHSIFNLLASMESNDKYTYRHNIGVAVLATLLGRWLNLNSLELSLLCTAAVLHDIGKMKIPDEILNKPGKLTDEEFSIIKKHTTYGYELIKNTDGASHQLALVALQHHEREDGSGYPFGLKSHEIEKLSKIVALADVFHAMISNRVYQRGRPIYQVIKQLQNDFQGKLTPEYIIIFVQKMMESMVGSEVLLTNGSKANIVMINPSEPTRPLIKVEDEFIDLSKNRLINIQG